jgi:alanine racemase
VAFITVTPNRLATRPTWAEVSLPDLRNNFRLVEKHVGRGVTICAVVKADAYGHGAVECSTALEEEGARWLGVTSLDEAIPLREAGVQARILLMTGFWHGEEEEIIRLNLTPTVWELWQMNGLEKAAAELGVARYPVHLKVDSGMGRLGAGLDELPQACSTLREAGRLLLEGVSTHLASSEVLDAESLPRQLEIFAQARRIVREAGFTPELVHVANTGAMISRPDSWNNMVRPGIALYGYHLPFESSGHRVNEPVLPVQPVLAWKTRVLSIRNVAADRALGYGGTYITQVPSRIAVLPVGYADGLNRKLSSQGRIIVRGEYAPIVGRISMDLTLVDVTRLPGVSVGDEVVLLGTSDGLCVDAREHAALADTVVYEILCGISKRVPRRFKS